MRKIFKFLMSRIAIFGILILIQVIALMGLIWGLGKTYTNIYLVLEFFSLILAVWIINGKRNPSYKLAWIMAMLAFPVFGGMFYVFFGIRHDGRRSKIRQNKEVVKYRKYLTTNEHIKKSIKNDNPYIYKISKYISDFSEFPPYINTDTQYLSPGEEKYKKLLVELQNAKKFIFLEYFIIRNCHMWHDILSILEKKVKQGVEVRIIYDDFGCLFTLPVKYNEKLKSKGIKCKVFNPLVPFINIYLNHRDHRKIAIIDGNVAFTGGTNLSDEYINEYDRLGHWKDCDVMIKGEAVWSMTVLFLQMWNFFYDEDEDWFKFKVDYNDNIKTDGYVQPFGDTPLDMENVYENVYRGLISNAKNYVYINTPYLIIDNEMVETLTLAAKSGVDIRIVCPGTPDKRFVNLVSQAFFPVLIEAGVKVYIYKPGFIHSKTFVVDDELGVIGSANMDYRSFYLHFEAGVLMFKSKAITQLKDDYINTLTYCKQVTLQDCKEVNLFIRIFRGILRVFSPMM